jgi:TfoX/Sxy family transcriptional regulator of competence genes
MAYNEKLAERIRERLNEVPNVREQQMMGGLTFMVNEKMCVGVFKDELMCRINPHIREELLEKSGCHTMTFTKRPMRGIVLVEESGVHSKKDFEFWITYCLDYNKTLKRTKKKKPKT